MLRLFWSKSMQNLEFWIYLVNHAPDWRPRAKANLRARHSLLSFVCSLVSTRTCVQTRATTVARSIGILTRRLAVPSCAHVRPHIVPSIRMRSCVCMYLHTRMHVCQTIQYKCLSHAPPKTGPLARITAHARVQPCFS